MICNPEQPVRRSNGNIQQVDSGRHVDKARVVFVDWYGVLSAEPFWKNIIEDGLHPHQRLTRELAKQIFTRDHHIVKAWMRGEISSQAILKRYLPGKEHKELRHLLLKSLYDGFTKATCAPNLSSLLTEARKSSHVVIATDNMECFSLFWNRIPGLSHIVDEVICSCDLGVLKSESSLKFFGKWLEKHRIPFADAILLDDSSANCSLFREAGGIALEVTNEGAACAVLSLWLSGGLHHFGPIKPDSDCVAV